MGQIRSKIELTRSNPETDMPEKDMLENKLEKHGLKSLGPEKEKLE